MAQHGKKYVDARGRIDRENLYSPVEAVRMLKELPGAANRRLAASSVAPVASGYERSLRPCETWFSRRQSTSPAKGDR